MSDEVLEKEAEYRARTLVEALPYIKKFHGKTFVIKLGGSALDEASSTLQDIVLLGYVGVNVVLVHGGGKEISDMQKRLGIEPKFIDGLRATDEQTMEVVKMVLMGKINPNIVAQLNHMGAQAIGLSGEDGPTLLAEPIDSSNDQMRHVGRIVAVNPEPISALIEKHYVPVLASIGLGYDGKSYNINADTAASEIAKSLNAAKLILMTDVDGVFDESNNLIKEIGADEASLLIERGIVKGGMIPKLSACISAVKRGCAAHIINGTRRHALLLELFTETGIGTMVTN
jgi:acetylglutamate kinase